MTMPTLLAPEASNRLALQARSWAKRVRTFNETILGLELPDKPKMLSFERGEFRLGHLREELSEIEKAISDERLDEAVDGLVDLSYVAMGTIAEMGVPAEAAFQEVHEANMRRVPGKNPQRGNVGNDAVKPPGWRGPYFNDLLEVTREEVETLRALRAGEAKVIVVKPGCLECRDAKCDECAPEQGLPAMQEQAPAPLAFPDRPLVDTKARTFSGVVRPKIMVMGYGRHGKDTVGEMLRDQYGFSFTSSSMFCAEHVMMPAFKALGKEYPSVEACYEDRHTGDNRAFWYDTILAYNTPDKTALGRAIFGRHDVYCGIRHHSEFWALRNARVFDLAVWVDASDRHPKEDRSSCSVEPWMADLVLDNNGTLDDLERNLHSLFVHHIRPLAGGAQ